MHVVSQLELLQESSMRSTLDFNSKKKLKLYRPEYEGAFGKSIEVRKRQNHKEKESMQNCLFFTDR